MCERGRPGGRGTQVGVAATPTARVGRGAQVTHGEKRRLGREREQSEKGNEWKGFFLDFGIVIAFAIKKI